MHDNLVHLGQNLMEIDAPVRCFSGERTLAQAIVDGLGQPLLVLDEDHRIVVANRSFCKTFGMNQRELQGQSADAISGGQPAHRDLRALFDWILLEETGAERVEKERHFPGLGSRRLSLNGLKVFHDGTEHKMILLALDDVTRARLTEAAVKAVTHHNGILLQEIQHRVGNSLQIIASILRLKAHSVQSEETRQHLQDAHRRVISIAAVQEQLGAAHHGETVAVGPYLARLCETLAGSLIAGRRIAVTVNAAAGEVQTRDAVSLGLIVTELLINAVKHAFPSGEDGSIAVDYESDGEDWILSVSDDGIGLRCSADAIMNAGLGSSVVEALARQLEAQVETSSEGHGTRVSIRRRASQEWSPEPRSEEVEG